MSKYEHMVKFNGKYYKAGEEVPDNIQPVKEADEPQQKEEQKKPETTPVKPDITKSFIHNPIVQPRPIQQSKTPTPTAKPAPTMTAKVTPTEKPQPKQGK